MFIKQKQKNGIEERIFVYENANKNKGFLAGTLFWSAKENININHSSGSETLFDHSSLFVAVTGLVSTQ